MKIERILLPTDLSGFADQALKQAVQLAVQRSARIDIFHAITLHADDPGEMKGALEDYLARVEKDVFDELSERSATIRQRGVNVEVSVARTAAPFEAILDKAEECDSDLIVMGTHGRGGVSKLLMGSVAEKVVRHARCHVLTVGKDAAVSEQDNGFETILVPVDFSELSERAVEAARTLLAPGGQLVLHHVVASPIHPSFYAGGITKMFELDPGLPQRVTKKLRELYDGPGEIVVTEGDIVPELLESRDQHHAELVVMGTKGLSGLDHMLIGSITERMVREARVPVLSLK